MRKISAFGAGLACALTCLLFAAPAEARDDFMTTGVATTAPIGHRAFCLASPAECLPEKQVASGPVVLEAAMIRRVAEINTSVNSGIKPISDMKHFGVEERWGYPDGQGDCEDYALLKRRLLHEAGISFSDLLMTVVRKRDGEGHAVLTLRTTQGDFVLDNLDSRVRVWRETPYIYLKRQISADPAKWVSIADGADVVVAALKK